MKRLPADLCESIHFTDVAKVKFKNVQRETELTDARQKTERKKQVGKNLEERLKLKMLDLQIIGIFEDMSAIDDNIEKFKKELGRLKDEIRVLEEQLQHLKISGLIQVFLKR